MLIRLAFEIVVVMFLGYLIYYLLGNVVKKSAATAANFINGDKGEDK